MKRVYRSIGLTRGEHTSITVHMQPWTKTTVAARVRWAREKAGVSARELARLAGLDAETHVSAIEANEARDVRASVGVALAHVLGVSVDWLLAGIGDTPDETRIRTAVIAAQGTRIPAAKGA